jgi:hypothetical protein
MRKNSMLKSSTCKGSGFVSSSCNISLTKDVLPHDFRSRAERCAMHVEFPVGAVLELNTPEASLASPLQDTAVRLLSSFHASEFRGIYGIRKV